jgi:hypothetical protein
MTRAREDIARDLHEYLAFRARREGVAYSLDPGFFLDALRRGAVMIFGIHIGADGIEADEQNPAAFAEWRKRRAN